MGPPITIPWRRFGIGGGISLLWHGLTHLRLLCNCRRQAAFSAQWLAGVKDWHWCGHGYWDWWGRHCSHHCFWGCPQSWLTWNGLSCRYLGTGHLGIPKGNNWWSFWGKFKRLTLAVWPHHRFWWFLNKCRSRIPCAKCARRLGTVWSSLAMQLCS